MKAMVLKEYNRFMETMDVEKPVVGENDVLIQVKACGICRTDLKIFRGEIPPPIVTLPHTPGHEVAGEVVEIGDKVTGIQKGDWPGMRISAHSSRESGLNSRVDMRSMSGSPPMPSAPLTGSFPSMRWRSSRMP